MFAGNASIPARVVVGMSGGVDSAVAAWLMQSRGYEAVGVFMNNWEEDGGECTAAQDYADMRRCCQALGMDYYSVSYAKEYYERVFAHFLAEYKAGRTPNPDVLCNREIKFGELLSLALRLGAQKLVTGHYARVREEKGAFRLYKGLDATKDQSYFLYMLTQRQLSRALFPLGELTKARVREIALEQGLPVAKKKDSTGVCFIGERNFKEFLSRYLPARPGNITNPQGRVLGRHDGLMYYTLGQRGGMGIGGGHGGDGRPWYVVGKDLPTNTLIAAQGQNHPLLFTQSLTAGGLTFTTGSPPGGEFDCGVKIRYRQSDQQARVRIDGDSCFVEFKSPQRAVTPGQSAVFYMEDECIGGGIIQ